MYWLLVILVAPAITMRLFALEKASGTFGNLMTTAVAICRWWRQNFRQR